MIPKPPRFLIILDVNGLLMTSEFIGMDPERKEELEAAGHPMDSRFVYFLRPGFHEFINKLIDTFDVGIWTCASERKSRDIFRHIFRGYQREKMLFFFNQTSAHDTGLKNPYSKHGTAPIYWKLLPSFYKMDFPYDVHNTLLIDDSPYKCFANHARTCLFAPTYSPRTGMEEDDFLLNMLWPVLEKLQYARDVRLFMFYNEPLWSRAKLQDDKQRHALIYENLERDFSHWIPMGIKTFPYHVLDISEYELPWGVKDLVTNLVGPVNKMSNKKVCDLVWDLGIKHYPDLQKTPRLFLEDVLKVRDTTSHFQNLHPYPGACTRNMRVDRSALKSTCTNRECEECQPRV